MRSSLLRKSAIPLLVILLLSGCLTTNPDQQATAQPLGTSVAQTVDLHETLAAGQAAIASLTEIARSSSTFPSPFPSKTTSSPTFILLPTNTPGPYTTSTAIPAPSSVACDLAELVSDVSVADNTIFWPGATFIKTWRIQNIGTCTWTQAYSMVFTGGDPMGGPIAVALPGPVEPGQTVDVSVTLTAPDQTGEYKGYWLLENQLGNTFGTPPNANGPFWVQIQVVQPPQISNYAFDFALNYCSAVWTSSNGNLPCPTQVNIEQGGVLLLDRPTLETGRREYLPVLETLPPPVAYGWITGTFPPYKVKSGDHFTADVGCLDNSPTCDVTFAVNFQLPDGSINQMGSWHEVFDGQITHIDLDLGFLTDQTVRFMLNVVNLGNPGLPNAFWQTPSIRSGSAFIGGQAAQAARKQLAQDMGFNVNTIRIVNVQPMQWSDSCLGIPIPNQVCVSGTYPGFRVILEWNGQQFEAHTNENGKIVYWFQT
jgi:hypothetical protein